METHYRPPDTVAPQGVVYAGLAALAGALLLAPIYSYAIVYIPFVYVNMILTAGFGFLVGLMIVEALRAGKVHNKAVSYVIFGGGVLFVYWMHWAWWISGLAFRADMDDFSIITMLFPPALIESIVLINEGGTWGIGSSNDAVSGMFLTVIWLIEAAVFFGVALVTAATTIGSGTFCARCSKWCKEMPATRLQADPTGELTQRVDRQDWSALMRPAPTHGVGMWHEAAIHKCEGCGETNTITLKDIHVTHDKKGNEQRKENVVVDRVYISGADLQTLMNS